MKVLVAAACVAIIAAVGYFFIGEYRASTAQAAAAQRQTARLCDERVKQLEAWKKSAPLEGSEDFAATRRAVEYCFSTLKGSDWERENKGVIYW